MRNRLSLTASAATAALLLTACASGTSTGPIQALDEQIVTGEPGSTSSQASTGPNGQVADGNDGSPGGDADATPTPGADGGGTTSPGSTGGNDGTGSSGDSTPSSGDNSPATPPVGGTTSPVPATKEPVQVGIQYTDNLGGALAAFGGTNLTGDDDWADFIQPIVEHVNATGGLAGHPIEPVYRKVDPANGSFAQQAQQTCADFTEDNDVVAAVGFVLHEGLIDCFREAGVPFVGQSVAMSDEEVFSANRGFFYQPWQIRSERLAPAWVDALVDQGYFEGATVGVLYMNQSTMKRFYENDLTPALAARGIEVADDFEFSNVDSAASAGALFNEANAAVLRFRSSGITHVILVPSNSGIPFAFMQSADSQNYNPRYTLNTLDVPAFIVANVPASQLVDTVGIGWMNATDIHFSEVPQGVNANEDLCRELTGRNGDEAKRYCDGLFFLQQAWAGADQLTPQALRAGVEALGSGYQSPWTFGTRFGPGRYDGATTIRHLGFVPDCTCFRYSSPTISIG